MYVIEVEHLSKSYGAKMALRGVTLRIPHGRIYGLLGPHGAGKSTLMHILMGFLRPSAGKIRLFNSDHLQLARQRLGFLPEHPHYYLRYTVRQYLQLLGRLSDMGGKHLRERIDEELARVGLEHAANQSLMNLSNNHVHCVGIAQALLTSPDVLLIDEPMSGFDQSMRHEALSLLSNVCSQGQTVLLATNNLEVIERVCDRVGVLISGRLAFEMDVSHTRGVGVSVFIEVDEIPAEVQAKLVALSSAVQCDSRSVTLRPNDNHLQVAVLRTLIDAGVTIVSLEPLERPFEHTYLEAVRAASLGHTRSHAHHPPHLPPYQEHPSASSHLSPPYQPASRPVPPSEPTAGGTATVPAAPAAPTDDHRHTADKSANNPTNDTNSHTTNQHINQRETTEP
jgi:ABC-2 type transport system ATP-binding protein